MQLDTAVVVPVVAACAAVVAAMWQVTRFVIKAGGMLQRFDDMLERVEEIEKSIALLPGMSERVGHVTSDVAQLAGNLASLVEEQRKLHSDHRELRQALAVEVAVRQHSEGDFR